jgi:hypothetical protein
MILVADLGQLGGGRASLLGLAARRSPSSPGRSEPTGEIATKPFVPQTSDGLRLFVLTRPLATS